MPYTLWLHGLLVGETDFEHPGPAPGQRLGAFRPTTAGLEVLPSICGLLAATVALKDEMERRGLVNPDDQADGMLEVLESTPEGERVVEIAKCLEQLELHDPNGIRLQFQSIAVSDLHELVQLGKLRASAVDEASETADESTPRYLISATFSAAASSGRVQRRPQPRLRPRWRH